MTTGKNNKNRDFKFEIHHRQSIFEKLKRYSQTILKICKRYYETIDPYNILLIMEWVFNARKQKYSYNQNNILYILYNYENLAEVSFQCVSLTYFYAIVLDMLQMLDFTKVRFISTVDHLTIQIKNEDEKFETVEFEYNIIRDKFPTEHFTKNSNGTLFHGDAAGDDAAVGDAAVAGYNKKLISIIYDSIDMLVLNYLLFEGVIVLHNYYPQESYEDIVIKIYETFMRCNSTSYMIIAHYSESTEKCKLIRDIIKKIPGIVPEIIEDIKTKLNLIADNEDDLYRKWTSESIKKFLQEWCVINNNNNNNNTNSLIYDSNNGYYR
jgi:hypothetical protein